MRLLLLVTLTLMTGCGARSGELASSPAELHNRRGGGSSRDLITRTDMETLSSGTALEIIQAMRPQWLRLRDEVSLMGRNDLVVYVNNARMGGRASLRNIPLADVQSIRYFDSAAAYLRWGDGHGHGVILISKSHYDDPRAF
jgi:hypothetical protein